MRVGREVVQQTTADHEVHGDEYPWRHGRAAASAKYAAFSGYDLADGWLPRVS